MSNSGFLELIDSGRYSDLEDSWLEKMESGVENLDEFLQAARSLGRQKEKDRARLLLGLLAEHLLERQNWRDRLIVLKEIIRHTHDLNRFEDLRIQIEDAYRHIYAGRPSLQKILQHFRFDEIRTPEELKPALSNIEQWLSYDVGQLFYASGQGVGRVSEINLSLGVMRIDFESKKDVSIYPGDSSLVPIAEGHILHEKFESPGRLREEAAQDPGSTLGRLLQAMEKPLTVQEIKECFNGIISAEQWSKWWIAARKNPQVLVSGKGAQATYSWSDSATAANQSLKDTFDEADIASRIELARQHASRGGEVALHFRETLLRDAKDLYEKGEMSPVIDLLDLFSRWPGGEFEGPGFTLEDIVRKTEARELLQKIENSAIKMKVLDTLQQVFPDQWTGRFVEAFSAEDNPRVLSFLYERLSAYAQLSEDLIDRVITRPFSAPAAFAWICQQEFAPGLGGKLLLALLSSLDENEFAPHRNKLKKAMDGGLLLKILDKQIDPDAARRALELLEHAVSIEDYRKDRWMTAIRMRFPEMKKKEDWIFSTKEALERKRTELEQLIKVELPANRKAVGEAAAHGDLSENHEYKAARERQDYLINRVQQLQSDLSRVRILEPGQADASEVRPGTRLTLFQNPDQRLTITILGPWDSNPKDGVYSYQSPAGASLLGKIPGEQVSWNDSSWSIEKIEPWI